MNDFMNNEEIKALLKRATEMMLPFYIASLKAKTKPAPTLSEILAEGSKRIDDAVQAVIARHEKEIAYDEAVQEETKRAIDQGNSRYFGRSQYAGLVGLQAAAIAQGQNRLLQQMGADRRDAIGQSQYNQHFAAQVGSASLSAGGWI
jgi:hypothetical protein